MTLRNSKTNPRTSSRGFADPGADYGEDDRDSADLSKNLMVALYLDSDVAAQLAVKNGLPAEQLHITLNVVPNASAMTDLTLAQALVAVQQACMWASPLSGTVGGVGRFPATIQSDNKEPFYCSVDVPDLEDLATSIRNAMECAGLPGSDDHGFVPHITLAYLDPGAKSPVPMIDPIPVNFRSVSWVIGDRTTVLPIGGYDWGYFSESGEIANLSAIASAQSNSFYFVEKQSQKFGLDSDGQLPNGGWVQVLPKPNVYHHELYGDMAITPDVNREFVENFNSGVYQPEIPVDAEHQTKLGGALGFVKEMRLNDDYSADARIELTPRGTTIMKADGFLYVSPEWFTSWEQPETGVVFHNVLIAVAFTNNPFFKANVMRPIMAASDHMYVPSRSSAAGGGAPTYTFSELPHAAKETIVADLKDEKKDEQKATPVQLSEAELAAFREYQAKKPELDQALQGFAEMKATIATQATELASIREEKRALKFAAISEKWVGDKTANLNKLTRLATVFGDESDEVKEEIQNMNAITEQAKSGDTFKEFGGDALPKVNGVVSDPVAEMQKLTSEAIAANSKLSKIEAFSQVCAQHPQLAERYRTYSNVVEQKRRENMNA